MALLNFGNALSQAGKAMATVGLEGVKATLEEDKVRLAAKLAAQEGLASDERKAAAAKEAATAQAEVNEKAASALAAVNTASATALVTAEKARVTEGRDFTASLADPNNKAAQNYLAGTKALMNADPAKQAEIQAKRDESALNVFKLEVAKKLLAANTELANADTPEKKQIAEQKVRGLTADSGSLNQIGSLAGSAAKLDEAILNSLLLARGRLASELGDVKGPDKAAVRKSILDQIKALDRTIAEQTDILKLSNTFAKLQIPGYPVPAPADGWVEGPDGVRIRKQ